MIQSPWGEMLLRDAHIHFFSRNFFDLLGKQKGEPVDGPATAAGLELPPADPTHLAERWVAQMDQHGVDCAALIASIPGDEASVAAAVAHFPSRFRGYFMTNPRAEDAMDRAESAFAAGLRGICFFPAMHGYSMADERADALVALAGRHRAVVFVHCGVLSVGIRGKLGLPSPFDLRYSNPVDVHAVALSHPAVRFVVPHFGAGYLREALMVASLCPNVYLDTSSSNGWMKLDNLDITTVFLRVLNTIGPDRLLFGSDSSFFPRGWVKQVFEAQAQALHNLGIGPTVAAKIFAGNFTRLFDIA